MQWRSIVLGLLLLRLGLHLTLWLLFGFGPSMGIYRSFVPFRFGFSVVRQAEAQTQNQAQAAKQPSWFDQTWVRGQVAEGHSLTIGDPVVCKRRPPPATRPAGTGYNFLDSFGEYSRKYSAFPEPQRRRMKEAALRMFYFGYENYMEHAFPEDELNPIDCRGRGPDRDNP